MSTPNAADPSEPKSRRGLVISFLVVLAMVLGGFVGAQIAQSGDDSSTTDSTEVPSTVVDEADTSGNGVPTAPTGDAPEVPMNQLPQRLQQMMLNQHSTLLKC